MSTAGEPHTREARGERARPRERFRPTAGQAAALVLWLAGLALALAVPAVLVPPASGSATTSEIWTAFGCTLAGSLVMVLAAFALRGPRRDNRVLTLGLVPAIACIAGGVIMLGTKLAT